MEITTQFNLGEVVYDDLTRERVVVIGITTAIGKCGTTLYPNECVIIGYWVDHPHLGGGRHPWELSKLEDPNDVEPIDWTGN